MAAAAAAAGPISAGVSLLGFVAGERQAGRDRAASELEAKQVEVGVIQREADRKDRLAAQLASQNALAGAAGIAAFEGSPLTVLEDSLKRERTATQRDIFSSELTALGLRLGARSRRRTQRLTAGLGLVQSLTQVAKT